MKKRLLIIPLAAMLLAGCGENPTPDPVHPSDDPVQPEPGPGPAPVITVESITITTQPNKVSYREGETFDPTGMVVTATMSDGTTKTVTNYQLPDQALVVGLTSISILYEGKTASVAITVEALPTYTITFMENENDKIEDVVYKEGEVPSHSFSKPSTAEFEYTFLGWSDTPNGDVISELPVVSGNAVYYAIIQQKTRKYSIIFKDEYGNQLSKNDVDYGAAIVAPEYNPTDTAQYDYSLVGWSLTLGGEPVDDLGTVSGEKTLYAVVSSQVRSYTIKFVDENGEELQSGSLLYGAQPSCDYEVEDTAEWDYTTKWSKTAGGSALVSIPTVTGDATYYAIVSKVKQNYNITFNNEDGTKYKTISVEYGAVPSVTAPTKTNTQQYSYSFAGWSSTKGGDALASLPAVTGPATYFATFNATVNSYRITFVSNYEFEDQYLDGDYGTSYDDFDDYVPEREGYHFAGWCLDEECEDKISFPYQITDDTVLFAKWNEKVDVLGYLKSLLKVVTMSPYDFVPDTLRPDCSDNYISVAEKTAMSDFSSSKNVSVIKDKGFGEQWQMVIDNLDQSETFYKILSGADGIVSAAATAFLNYFEGNPDKTEHEEKETNYDASCEFKNGVLVFGITFKKSISIPVVGSFEPVIEMTYDVVGGEKTIVISLNDYNKLKCSFSENGYIFGIQYGVEIAYRTAYCEFTKIEDEEENVSYEGHIYEHINAKDADRLSSAADFYIDDTYCSVVGNKADGILLMDSYINELYDVESGHLLGYKVMETKTLFKITKTYDTLWFNLKDIPVVNSVSLVKKESFDEGLNPYTVSVNGNAFMVARNGFGLTSRKYDIELRKHYYYGLDDQDALTKYSLEIPMMFIQDGDNFESFENDMKKTSGIENAEVTLADEHLQKIRDDYEELIPGFIDHKDAITSEIIIEWLK